MARPRLMRRVGVPAPIAHQAALRKAIAPMLASVRSTLPKIVTVAHTRQLDAVLRRQWGDSKIRRIVRDIGQRAEISASRPWSVLVGRNDAAYDAEDLVDKWSREAAKKITSVRDEVAEKLRSDIVAAAEAGLDHEALASRWMQQGGVPTLWGTAEGRVRVIAQHQLSMLHAEVQRARAQSVGVHQFVWRTQGDDKVREEHRILDGALLDYSKPGAEGLPGHPVNCRCWAESVIPDDFDPSDF